MQVDVKELVVKGKPVTVTSICIDDIELIVSGNYLRSAQIEGDWYKDIGDPQNLITTLKTSKVTVDIFTFLQKFPESDPKYKYYFEWDNLAAIPIKNYDYWFNEQIEKQSRNKIRKAAKMGVDVRMVDFNDEFIRGMTDIFNEIPTRQGKKFWHYGKDFETIKQQFKKDSDKCDFIGAYYDHELIGFIWLFYGGGFARTTQFLSKYRHRDKSSANALLAKAVEICSNKAIPYLLYGKFDYGKTGNVSLTDFKRHNGFKEIRLPRYYIPLTVKGRVILKLNLHHGIIGILPKKIINLLLDSRKKWYSRKMIND